MVDYITVAVVALYFLGMLGIGFWASKKIKNTDDYLNAGQSLGFWMFVLLMIGTVCSGMSLLGVSGTRWAGRPCGNRSLSRSRSRSVSSSLA